MPVALGFKGYIVEQKNHGIFGVGSTLKEAVEDSREWLDPETEIDEDLPNRVEAQDGEICWVYCSNGYSM